MNTRYKKHLEAFKNTVVSVVSSDDGDDQLYTITTFIIFLDNNKYYLSICVIKHR